MKITLVTEHRVIIGELVAPADPKCSCAGRSTLPPPARVETHPALAHSYRPCGDECGPPPSMLPSKERHAANRIVLPAAMIVLPPCAVGDHVTFNVKVTNVVERNA